MTARKKNAESFADDKGVAYHEFQVRLARINLKNKRPEVRASGAIKLEFHEREIALLRKNGESSVSPALLKGLKKPRASKANGARDHYVSAPAS